MCLFLTNWVDVLLKNKEVNEEGEIQKTRQERSRQTAKDGVEGIQMTKQPGQLEQPLGAVTSMLADHLSSSLSYRMALTILEATKEETQMESRDPYLLFYLDPSLGNGATHIQGRSSPLS